LAGGLRRIAQREGQQDQDRDAGDSAGDKTGDRGRTTALGSLPAGCAGEQGKDDEPQHRQRRPLAVADAATHEGAVGEVQQQRRDAGDPAEKDSVTELRVHRPSESSWS